MTAYNVRVLNKLISLVLRSYYCGYDHPMKLRIWTHLRRLTSYRRLTIPYMRTGWITLDERDYLEGVILKNGAYEPEVWRTLANSAQSNEIVWDIGSNIGSFAICALLDSRVAEVHAFEPDPLHAEVLAYNLGLNRGHCKIHRFALSNKLEQKVLLHAVFPHGGGSTFIDNPQHGQFDGPCHVDCSTIDHLVYREGAKPPTLLKIDVEGWEMQVLEGAIELMRKHPPKAIVVECDF